MTSMQSSTCGLQICSHPLCWDANRRIMREFNKLVVEQLKIMNRPQQKEEIIEDHEEAMSSDDDDDDSSEEETPTLTVINMLDGFGGKSKLTTENLEVFRKQSAAAKPTVKISENAASRIGKLDLKTLVSSSDHVTLVPANTPLHSAHGFGDNLAGYREDISESISEQSKSIMQTTKAKYYKQQKASKKSEPKKFHTKNIQFDLPVKKTNKKILVWQPNANTPKRPSGRRTKERKLDEKSRSHIITLPVNEVPAFDSKQPHALRGGKPKTSPRLARKTIQIPESQHPTTPRESLERGTQTIETMATASEIAMLQSVPMDVLLQVLEQAEMRGVLQPRHTAVLLNQVKGEKLRQLSKKGKRDALPSEPMFKENVEVPASLETKKISSESPRMKQAYHIPDSPRQAYKLDENFIGKPRVLSTAPSGMITHLQNPVDVNLPRTAAYNQRYSDQTTQIDVNLEDSKPGKDIPVKQIATIFKEDNKTNVSVKPFRYSKDTREIFLGPMPSPPPSSPETERDSQYDPEVGGSTVLVNPSSNVPSTIFSEQRMSPPPKGSSWDGRSKATTEKTNRHSPIGSNVEWPSIQEDDYLVASPTQNTDSPMLLSYREEEISLKSEAKTNSDESPLIDQFQNLRHSETHSPAPPPPSPEIPSSNTDYSHDTRPTSKLVRVEGAATAMGITAPKPAKNSPDQSTPQQDSNSTPLGRTSSNLPQVDENK